MLDMIPEPGGYVRWINKQTILPGNEHGLMISYRHARSNCENSMMQIIGEGDTIERMAVNRPTGMFHLVEGSSAYESTAVACRERSYANSGGVGRVY
ncbi:hypothetical protein [Methylobacterium sp. WL6]|uniref:hypothetical protein n=1 Tax=Methylobacterium sp. WL6 TaxID=2603901 RepID=UPI0011CB1A1D|nr:hypothetical protein [Methylobacterium sp. WL6]TXN65362.1 hypothetical protein FV230_17015 [Methylobacterium sp. WL6]